MGVIDTLSAGYTAVNRRLWLLSIPISLDLFFWVGPRIGLGRLTTTLALPFATPGQGEGAQAVPASFNLLMLLALHVPTYLGSALKVGEAAEAAEAATGATGSGAAVLLALVLIPLGLLVASVYLTGIAQLFRKPAGGLEELRQSAVQVWGRALKLHALLLAVGLGVGLPGIVLLVLSAAVHEVLATVLLVTLQLAALWAAIHLYFVLPAVVVGGHGPVAAVMSSVKVVRRSLWAAVGLIAVILVISIGMPMVWGVIRSQPIGMLVSIVANAYVMTGLSAATLLFYHDRTRRSADRESPEEVPPAASSISG